MTFNDAVFNDGIVTDINIIQNDGVFDHTVLSDKYLLKQDGILHSAVDDTAAGKKTVVHLAARIVFCRRKVIHLGVNLWSLAEEEVSYIRLEEIHIGAIIILHTRDIAPVILQLVTKDPFHTLVAN